jgi:glycosyltransferase involved in cell wall biosynthesis
MLLSVITPLHEPGNAYVAEAYASLCRQTHRNWQWVVLENAGGSLPTSIAEDPRVVRLSSALTGIGALKRAACLASDGEAIVELDADDVLADDALEQLAEAFGAGADFVFSDFAEFRDEAGASWPGYPYGASYGWEHYTVEHRGRTLVAMRAPPATAQNLRRIEWSPNHVRAWTREAYEAVGGHDPKLAVADDHDLVVRFYLASRRFVRLGACLYFYRVHPRNTVRTQNRQIREGTDRVYRAHGRALAEAWARHNELGLIDLCGGVDPALGYLPVDRHTDVGLECDLDGPWPIADGSVGVIRASDAVEHLRDPVHTMNEAWRVLAPGGYLLVDVPSTNGLGAFCDPTHVSFWNRLSFRYYTEARFARYVPAFRGRFQLLHLDEHYPTQWHRNENVPYVTAHLAALKPGYEPMGILGWPRD